MRRLRKWLLSCLAVVSVFSVIPDAWAFCGFYVAGADSQLYNQASQVAIARNGNQTVLTMANDYKGDVADFALVVPVPTVISPEQVKVIEPKPLERLDTYSAPRHLGTSWIQPSDNQWQLYKGDVFLTRLHVRYTHDTFPEDLAFYPTRNQQAFQRRYVINQIAVPNKTAEQCADDVINILRTKWEYKQNQGDTTEDFVTFTRSHLDYWMGPNGTESLATILDWLFRDPVNQDYPELPCTDDPFNYINRLSEAIYAQYDLQVVQQLEAEARTLSQVTGWPIRNIRQQITEETPGIPETWRLRYSNGD